MGDTWIKQFSLHLYRRSKGVRYFLLKTDPQYNTAPVIENWYPTIDLRLIHKDSAHNLPNRELLFIRPNPDTVFTDILHSPFFLSTNKIQNVIKMYEPATRFKEIVLLDRTYAKSELYYLPILEHCDCISPKSDLTMDRSSIKRAVLDLNKIGDRSIFYLDGVRTLYTVVRLDVAESILRRNVCGVGLEPIFLDNDKT